MIDYKRVYLEEVRNPERFNGSTAFLEEAVQYAVDKIFSVMKDFVHQYPQSTSENLIYKPFPDIYETDWVAGFWTGMLWLSYEMTGNEIYRAVAETQFDDYLEKYNDFSSFWHHDIGFVYIPSIVAQYKITGSLKAKELAVKAADALADRYSEKAGIIQVRNRDKQGTFIIDCCMNVPLLFWASHITGKRSYFVKALSHMYKAIECMILEDGSTRQGYQIDEATGEKIGGGKGGQGCTNENSCWARGQAWMIYGLAIMYRYAGDRDILEMAKRVANYYLNRLPSDHVCNVDLMLTGDDDQRDSSAAPIVACGLLELAKHLDDSDIYKKIYTDAAVSMMQSLWRNYSTQNMESNGLLHHGIYVRGHADDGECCMWGDYFYMEALMRLKDKNWKMYW